MNSLLKKNKNIILLMFLLITISVIGIIVLYKCCHKTSLKQTKESVKTQRLTYKDSIDNSLTKLSAKTMKTEWFLKNMINKYNGILLDKELLQQKNMEREGAELIKKKGVIIHKLLNRLLNGENLNDCYGQICFCLDGFINVVVNVNGAEVNMYDYCRRLRIMGKNSISVKNVIATGNENNENIELNIVERLK